MTDMTDRVNALVNAALAGIDTVEGSYSETELVSAVMTLALRTINALMAQNPEHRASIRQGVGVLMLACADLGKPN